MPFYQGVGDKWLGMFNQPNDVTKQLCPLGEPISGSKERGKQETFHETLTNHWKFFIL